MYGNVNILLISISNLSCAVASQTHSETEVSCLLHYLSIPQVDLPSTSNNYRVEENQAILK